jgi:hypothetical protein
MASFGDLDDDVLALLQDVLDRRRIRPALAAATFLTSTLGAVLVVLVRRLVLVIIIVVDGLFIVHEVRRVQERALLRPDIDEGGLDAWEDGIYPSDENVSDQSFDVRSVDEQLNQLVVFENGYSSFSICCADEDFAFHRKPPTGQIHATRGCARAEP